MTDRVVVLGASSGIGAHMCEFFLQDGCDVVGTCRTPTAMTERLASLYERSFSLIHCDLMESDSVAGLVDFMAREARSWDFLFSAIGTTEPIGNFFDLEFGDWERSIRINVLGQLRVIHALYPFHDASVNGSVVLLAGAGTNSALVNYSAYCASKVMLIKMCELLDAESEKLKFFIVGPGFVRTRVHEETLRAGRTLAGENYDRVKSFLDSGEQGTGFEEIYRCIRGLGKQSKASVGGRNFSVVHDGWGSDSLVRELEDSPDMYRLRRYGNEWQGGSK